MSSFINKGSEWRKWDLHFHTPSSFDYKDKNVTNEDIINTLKGNNISVVAITDHHFIDVERIKQLQELGKSHSITVLPGIEFCSELGGSDSIHFIGIFSEQSNIINIWETIKVKADISDELRNNHPEKVYCRFENTCKCIQELGGIITLHAGTKTNSVEAIKNNYLTKQEFKINILSNFTPMLEVSKIKSIEEYNKIVFPNIGFTLPIIICSDNHNIKEYQLNNPTWIKADPTFEGLKQVLYESKDRVRIQETQPEYKSDYSYLSKIELKKSDYWNQELYLNKNLNVIIGGRSTGKSTLLTSIAEKFNNDAIKFKKTEKKVDSDFFEKIQNEIEIYWGNGLSDYTKEICFIEQNKMISIAQDNKEKKDFLEQFIYDDVRKKIFDDYHSFINENSITIQTNIANLFIEYNNEMSLLDEIKSIGIKKEIETEVTKLKNEKNGILLQSNVNENLLRNFENIQKQLILLNEKEKELNNTKNELTDLTIQDIFYKRNIIWRSEINTTYKQELENKINELNENVNKILKSFISSMIDKIDKELQQIIIQKNNIIKSEYYRTGKKAIENNNKILVLNHQIIIEEQKIKQIEEKEKKLNSKKALINQLCEDIVNNFLQFKQKNEELIDQIHFNNEGIDFFITGSFDRNRLEEFLISSFDMRVNISLNDIINIFIDEKHNELIQFIKDINNNKYSLKSTINKEDFLKNLFSQNWYDYQYDIKYEEDTFSKMSPGKQAFIILRLLLNVSTKNCPILIDQPEDSLDNRSIYHELVKYIRETKTKRQLILVTHNPNIVVSADSELVIVANQHGINNKNLNDYKFQYVSGSLESDFIEKDKNSPITLYKMNIREHICDILEGGKEAFEHREKKYGFK